MDNQIKDFYAILDVDRKADLATIKRAFDDCARTSHPDRFNRETHPKDWEIANKKFRIINEAWATLKDSAKRAAYDRKLEEFERSRFHGAESQRSHETGSSRSAGSGGASGTPPPNAESGAERPSARQHRSAFLLLEAMPPDVRNWLLSRQAESVREQMRIPLGSPTPCFVAIGGCFFISAVALAISVSMPLSVAAVFALALCCILACATTARLALPYFCKIGRYFYVTPLYLIETGYNQAAYWTYQELKEAPAVEKVFSKDGKYSHTSVRFKIGNAEISFVIKSTEDVIKFLATLTQFLRSDANQLHHYLLNRDDLRTLDGQLNTSPQSPRPRFVFQAATTGALTGTVLAFSFTVGNMAFFVPERPPTVYVQVPPASNQGEKSVRQNAQQTPGSAPVGSNFTASPPDLVTRRPTANPIPTIRSSGGAIETKTPYTIDPPRRTAMDSQFDAVIERIKDRDLNDAITVLNETRFKRDDPRGHYLFAIIFHEQGYGLLARDSLIRAVDIERNHKVQGVDEFLGRLEGYHAQWLLRARRQALENRSISDI